MLRLHQHTLKPAGLSNREFILTTSIPRSPDITNSRISLNKHEQKLRQLRYVQGPMRPRQERVSLLAMPAKELALRESRKEEADEENDVQHRQFKLVATRESPGK